VTVDEYIRALRRDLPRGRHARRVLVEVEDYLRDASLADGEEAAVERFGSPSEVAAAFAPTFGASATRASVACVLVAVALAFATFPLLESVLPPAPWPSGPPDYLHWKQQSVLGLFLAGTLLALAGGAALLFRRLRAARVLTSAAAVALTAMLVLDVVLSYQWHREVPGAPGPIAIALYGSAIAALVLAALGHAARAASLSTTRKPI
jgi:HAAS domain-containing protein